MNQENMKRGGGAPTPGATEGPVRPLWITILAAAGIIAVIAAFGIGIFQLVTRGANIENITAVLGDIFAGPERIVLTAEEWTINSGETAEITFEHRGRRADAVGRYEIEFGDIEGVTVTLNEESAALGEAINLGEETPTVLAVNVQTTKERYTDLPITARFVGEAETVQSTATLTVVNMDIDPRQVPQVPEERPVERPAERPVEDPAPEEVAEEPVRYITVKRYVGRISDPLGTADLHVRVTSVGFDDEGRFRAQERIKVGDRAVVSFTITNLGTKETGAWTFSAFLPVGGGYHFRSEPQPTLLPGDRMEYALSFEDIREGNRVPLYIHVDPTNTIRELSELNNVVEAVFRVTR